MGAVVLLVFELALVARMVLDWMGVLAPGGGRWSIPARRMAHAVAEPVGGCPPGAARFVRGGS